MTREEKIELLEFVRQGLLINARVKSDYDIAEALGTAISALKGPTREQVEKVWRGEWEPGNPICPICGKDKFDRLDADIWADWMPNFCPNCGAPMTYKAVEMVMERLEALYGKTD